MAVQQRVRPRVIVVAVDALPWISSHTGRREHRQREKADVRRLIHLLTPARHLPHERDEPPAAKPLSNGAAQVPRWIARHF